MAFEPPAVRLMLWSKNASRKTASACPGYVAVVCANVDTVVLIANL
ncbi:MAG TPA: hypothetical protein VND96_13610 [Candidatus Micrarchaeaceae archaeon]|nr:hypothetical protein [Candidatus Micrarchaeaceae archaeon]